MKVSPRVAGILVVIILGVPAFGLSGVVGMALKLDWLPFVVLGVFLFAFALTGALPERWPPVESDRPEDRRG